MKLNNKGWELKTMLWLMALIFCLLLYVVLNSYKISGALASFKKNQNPTPIDSDITDDSINVPKKFYYSNEELIEDAANKYVEEIYNGDYITRLIITKDSLQKTGIIGEIKDPTSKKYCDYYAIVEGNSIDGYLKCDNYTTEGY